MSAALAPALSVLRAHTSEPCPQLALTHLAQELSADSASAVLLRFSRAGVLAEPVRFRVPIAAN